MKKGLETWLFSSLGVVAMLGILIAANFIAARGKQRIDLTAERAYTLSPGTRAILAKLDTPVQVRLYCTRSENDMPVYLKTYAQRVEDLLGEFRQASRGLVEIQKLDPQPDSDAEDSAKLDGIEGQRIQAESEEFYLGLSVSMLDQKDVIPFLGDIPDRLPKREQRLEYDIARALSSLMTSTKPVVGIMSPLPVAGMPMNPMMMQMGRRGEPAWAIHSELSRDFTVRMVEMSADKIPDDVKVLVVIHPKGITDTTQYALDQFVLRGGKLIAFLDALSALDQQAGMMGGMPTGSSIDKLLKAWGIAFDTTKVVADMNFGTKTQEGMNPALLTLTENAVSQSDMATANSDNLWFVFAGAFSGAPIGGLQETVLVKSSKDSQLVDPMIAQMSGGELLKSFKASGTEYPLAVRLEGKFKTAFPDGKPKAPEAKNEEKKPDEKKDVPAETGLKESAEENVVILVGDSDLLQNQIAVVQVVNPFNGQRMSMPRNGNLAMSQSMIEQLAGDSNLIRIRSRASRARPFNVVQEIAANAAANSRSRLKELDASLAEAQTKLSELQRSKTPEAGQHFILSPEQQAEIAKFRKKETEVKQQLKAERKKLRTDIDSLETRVKWINIAAMPLVVAAAGLLLALTRRRQAAH
ncbi:MAG: GldG family protein [Chthoniobacter sp.]|nr:GldG family protein [Chthoniobacter sp.]